MAARKADLLKEIQKLRRRNAALERAAKKQSAALTEAQARTAEAQAEAKEALDQQTATGEILQVISRCPSDIQPVLDAVAMNAAVVCGATDAIIMRADGLNLRRVAHFGPIPLVMPPVRPLTAQSSVGRVILECRTIHLDDISAPEAMRDYPENPGGSGAPWRTMLTVPLVREGKAIGSITIRRTEVRPFTGKQIALLQTFADQAVIAIENVRLFTEVQTSNRDLTTALDKQTATSDILRVISRSQTDVQPVFDTILTSAVRLLRGHSGALTRLAGDQIELAAHTSVDDAGDASLRAIFPQSLHSELPHGQAIRQRAPINTVDTQSDPRIPEPVRASARARGYHSWVTVPMLRQDEAVGTIAVTRTEAGGFTDDEIALLQTFANQAVIAIENVRLFTELQASNRDLTKALDTQTATSDILRVISGSRTDVQPVFEAIASNARRLCNGDLAGVVRYDGRLMHVDTFAGLRPEERDAMMQVFSYAPSPTGVGVSHAIFRREVAHVPDVWAAESGWNNSGRMTPLLSVLSYRALVAAPLLQGDQVYGAITVWRRQPGAYSEAEVALLQTFADQAVIAIENARLLSELQERTHALTRSVDQLTALGDVGRAVSSSLDLDTVLNTIVSRAVQLCGADGGTLYEYDELTRLFELRATTNIDMRRMDRTSRLRLGEGAVGVAGETRAPVQIPDISVEGAYDSSRRPGLIRVGTRALLAVPMLCEERLLGGIVVGRRTPGEFASEVIGLLQSFATQSALAIQNARLFREIEIKSRELEVASQHKSEFLASMSHELRTPLNAVIGFSEVLLEKMFGDVNDKQEEYLRDIHTSAEHLLSLINDILDLSKIEAGRMELDLGDFHLPSAIDDALLLMRERAARRGLALERHVDQRLDEICADQRKVKQVLLNLLSNAVKFTPDGGRIDVRAALVDGSVEISVTDTGIGIAPEDHEAVFEEFKQVGKAEKKAEGTGLGLALCRKFVELHGGRIWVKSQLGTGSTFTFSLPLTR